MTSFIPQQFSIMQVMSVQHRAFWLVIGIGTAQKSLEETIDFVKQRQVMGRSLSKWQAVATELANSATQLEAARMLCYRALSLKGPAS